MQIYFKKETKFDKWWENHNLIGIVICFVLTIILSLSGLYGFSSFNWPKWIITAYLIGIWLFCLAFLILRKSLSDLSKSIAFIKKDDVLYEIAISDIDENSTKEQLTDTYITALNKILDTNTILNNVYEFYELKEPTIEKENKLFIWISFLHNGQRTTMMFRNVYDLDMLYSPIM